MEKVKPFKVFILVNTLHSVTASVYANHLHMIGWSAKHIPGLEFEFWAPPRMSIDNARNTAAQYALERECDYLFFLDDDVQVPPFALKALLEADKDVVAGLIMIRGYPFNVMAFKFENKKVNGENKRNLGYFNNLAQERLVKNDWIAEADLAKKRPKLTKRQWSKLPMRLVPLQACDAVGFSCCLIKVDVLKPLETPYFLTGKYHTEDVYFCMKITENLRPKPSIYLHTGVQGGHMLNPEPIEYGSKPLMKAFYGMMYGKEETPFSRNEDYIEQCLAEIAAKGIGVQ